MKVLRIHTLDGDSSEGGAGLLAGGVVGVVLTVVVVGECDAGTVGSRDGGILAAQVPVVSSPPTGASATAGKSAAA